MITGIALVRCWGMGYQIRRSCDRPATVNVQFDFRHDPQIEVRSSNP